jgi:hypothetical protein
MLKPHTHFQQVPLAVVKSLVQKEIREDQDAQQLPPTQEKDSKTALKAKG